MNLFRSRNALLCLGTVLFLTSCGSGGGDKTSSTDTTAAVDSTAKAQPANTIVTSPENRVIITHKVANFARWFAAYEAHDSARLAVGIHDYVVERGLEDSNLVMVGLKVDDTAKAKAFSKDPGLKAAMKKGGVLGAPTFAMVTETWQDTAKIETTLRSRSSFTVKDWDTFAKAFEDGKQERTDNGIIARVLGHDLDNNKRVHVVTAISDSAKAFAYYKSDALKKRKESAGVIGESTRTFWRIVKRY